MKFLLDTNVVCEMTARQPEKRVLIWLNTQASECCLSCVTLGEIWKGIHRLAEGKRKLALTKWAEELEQDFSGQLLELDLSVLKTWGKLYANNESKGFNMDVIDSLIAATALVHGLTVITRNTNDFPAEVKTKNPWQE